MKSGIRKPIWILQSIQVLKLAVLIIFTQVIAGAVAGLGGAVEQHHGILVLTGRFSYICLGWCDRCYFGKEIILKLWPFAAFFLSYIRVGQFDVRRSDVAQNELGVYHSGSFDIICHNRAFMAG